MFPKLCENGNLKDINYLSILYDELNTLIESFECHAYFHKHLEFDQSAQRKTVSKFQNDLFIKLNSIFTHICWQKEYKAKNSVRDAIDIFGQAEDFVVIIEIDKHRADQVAKKFVSREALFHDSKIIYISLCYPGTKNMNVSECKKYFGYCNKLSQKMNNLYAGYIIE